MNKYFYTIKNFIILLGLMGVMVAEPIFSQEVEVIGDLKITNGSQGEGKILVSDTAGVARWVSKTDLLIDLHKDLEGGLVRLIQWGVSPVDIWASGVPYNSMIGLELEGIPNNGVEEYIFYIDTLNLYPFVYLTTGDNQATYRNWACNGMIINGADGQLLGDGEQNMIDVLTDCPSPPNPWHIFNQVDDGLSPDHHIASDGEAQLIYNVLIQPGIYDPLNGSGNLLWTSTEAQGANEATHAMAIDTSTGLVTEQPKSLSTRALVVKRGY